MDRPEHDYGPSDSIDAEAVGRPGQRRFRLLVRSGARNACVWMEKAQLAGVGAWLEETAAKLDRDEPNGERDIDPEPFGAIFELDFRASQLGLGYNEDQSRFVIQAFDAEATVSTPRFRCQLSRGQARVLARKIEAVVAAGRPICPLCQQPMEPEGHTCPRSNGHHIDASV